MITPASIRALRARLKLSQTEFATILDTTCFTVSRWERGVSHPQRYYQRKLDELKRTVELRQRQHAAGE